MMPSATTADPAAVVPVVEVVDGDTLRVRLNGRSEKVRALGIDAPESAAGRPPGCFGREAAARARDLLADQSVRLVYDPTQGDRDESGRLLAYVELPDASDFGAAMLAEGYARESADIDAYQRQQQYRSTEAAARERRVGIWSPSICADSVAPLREPSAPAPPGPSPVTARAVSATAARSSDPQPTVAPVPATAAPPGAVEPTSAATPTEATRGTAIPNDTPARTTEPTASPAVTSESSPTSRPPATRAASSTRTATRIPTASPTRAATRTPTASPTTPTRTPTSTPSNTPLEILSLTSPISPGSSATLAARTAPNAACRIEVIYKNGPSSASGLGPKSAGADGSISWTWRVGSNTTTGDWPVTVTCAGASRSATLSIRPGGE
jgi:endonuclease YncB( thermonuclease family)